MWFRMDTGSGIAQIQAKFFDSLEELKKKELKLADLESQLQLGQQKLDEDKDRLIEERKRLTEREEELTKEKEMMGEFSTDESDIIELSVQGNLIQTHRSTLTQVSCLTVLENIAHCIATHISSRVFVAVKKSFA